MTIRINVKCMREISEGTEWEVGYPRNLKYVYGIVGWKNKIVWFLINVCHLCKTLIGR